MNRITTLFFLIPFALCLACGKRGKAEESSAFAQTYEAGETAEVEFDIDADDLPENLTVTSTEADPEVEWLGLFEISIRITGEGGGVLYSSDWVGELGWFSVEIFPFELKDSDTRNVVLLRTGCSGVGMEQKALFLFHPEGTYSVYSLEDGNEGTYDADGNGIPDMLISRFRCDYLGWFGATSPWLSFFSVPYVEENELENEDKTFWVLERDEKYRNEWMRGLEYAHDELVESDLVETIDEGHTDNLKMLLDALSENAGEEETKNIYYTSFF